MGSWGTVLGFTCSLSEADIIKVIFSQSQILTFDNFPQENAYKKTEMSDKVVKTYKKNMTKW